MKKTAFIAAMLLAGLTFVGCKPKQSTYRQVYEQAKQREIAQNQGVSTAPETDDDATIVSKPAQSAVAIRRERINAVEGENRSLLHRYSVVVGSFQNKTNAYALKERMQAEGYTPVLAENELGMLRVIVSSHSSREEAIASRDEIKARFAPNFQDAWLLEREGL